MPVERPSDSVLALSGAIAATVLAACAMASCGDGSRAGEADGSDGDGGVEDPGDVTGSNMCPGDVQSFVWIANSEEGTLSKICTITAGEVARYATSPGGMGDPSRTSVNLHGDVVVTNRNPQIGPSSVTKIAASVHDCPDRNENGKIDTSRGPDDVLPWGEDECVLWNSPLDVAAPIGARATAWDGGEDPETGLGGKVWIGSIDAQLFALDGDDGEVIEHSDLPVGAYGGAVDGRGGLWIVDWKCVLASPQSCLSDDATCCRVVRVDQETLETAVYEVPCGYGISIDSEGRVWTAGQGCVSRLDPETHGIEWFPVDGFNRGVAVDGAGSVWAACTDGDLTRVDEETVTAVHRFALGVAPMVGVAVDFEGYVWAVSQGGDEAYRVDPITYESITVPIGLSPYTYSDMTGVQLRNVVRPE